MYPQSNIAARAPTPTTKAKCFVCINGISTPQCTTSYLPYTTARFAVMAADPPSRLKIPSSTALPYSYSVPYLRPHAHQLISALQRPGRLARCCVFLSARQCRPKPAKHCLLPLVINHHVSETTPLRTQIQVEFKPIIPSSTQAVPRDPAE